MVGKLVKYITKGVVVPGLTGLRAYRWMLRDLDLPSVYNWISATLAASGEIVPAVISANYFLSGEHASAAASASIFLAGRAVFNLVTYYDFGRGRDEGFDHDGGDRPPSPDPSTRLAPHYWKSVARNRERFGLADAIR